MATTSVHSQNSSNQNCFISIMDFGAQMNGTHDDSDAIRSSLKAVGYAYIPAGENGARVESTIVVGPNQNIFGTSRASFIKSYVPAGTFTIRAEGITNLESVHIKDLSIDVQVEDANGIQIYESRNVYIDNVVVLGNRKCNTGIQINGGSEKGAAWNQITRYTITRCKLGLELTSNTVNNFCNRNYVGFGLIQSCTVGVRLYRSSTNTILSCPQGCPTGISLEKARLNTIDTYIENSNKNSIIIDSNSNFNTISGQWKVDKYIDKGKSNLINLNRPKNQPTKLH
ncbi:MAG: hypothetical protein ABJM06_03165 [Gilvibacter sp.]